jgi:hypothetical protein
MTSGERYSESEFQATVFHALYLPFQNKTGYRSLFSYSYHLIFSAYYIIFAFLLISMNYAKIILKARTYSDENKYTA